MTDYLYGYTSPPKRLTLVELEARTTWTNLDAEFRRRLIALFDAAQAIGHDVGIGGGWRSSALQEATFRQRYTPSPSPPGIQFDGLYWTKKPGVASAAPPGSSYHESGDGVVHLPAALAADLIGDIAWAGDTTAARFGLRDFSDVNNESWHFQPVEIPAARRNYDGEPLPRFQLPGENPPDDEEEYVLEYVLVPKHVDAQGWWPWLACYSSGAVRPLGPGGPKVPHIDVTDIGQYRRICAAAGIQLVDQFP